MKQTAIQLMLSKWRGKMTQDQFAMWLSENQNLLLAMEWQQMKDSWIEGSTPKRFIYFEQYFTETYGDATSAPPESP